MVRNMEFPSPWSCSNCTNLTPPPPTPPNKKLFLALVIFELIICVLGSAGNALTCFAVMRSRKLHSATYFFVLSLSMADFLITSVLVPVRTAEHLSVYHQTQAPSKGLINVAVFIGRATILASFSSLSALSIDRYLALRFPIKYRATMRYNFTGTLITIVSIWASSLLFTSIPLIPGVSALQGLFIFAVLVFFMTFIMIVSSWNVFRLLKQLSLRLKHFKLTVPSAPLSPGPFAGQNQTTHTYMEIDSSPRIQKPRANSMPIPEILGNSSGVRPLPVFENKAFNSDDRQPVRLLNVIPIEIVHVEDEPNQNTPTRERENTLTFSSTSSSHLSPRLNGSAVSPSPIRRSAMVRQLADGYIAKTIGIIIGTFVLCIYPRIILIIYHFGVPETPQSRICRLWLKLLLYINSVINPVLYAWRFRDFRREFLNLLKTLKRTIWY